ncbi:MAG: NAD(P)/FAD-dependent oxidoreductase [Xanthomonadales bacterium]|nr:NAD(P)/FAD-dependent oxidoreductase [Xanthomonadales bacterium]
MQTDLAIVGAGPGGMAAADMASRLGLSVMVIDEQGAPGGQIYRQPPPEFQVPDWLTGRAYRQGRDLLKRIVENDSLRLFLRATVSGIDRDQGGSSGVRFKLTVDGPDRMEEIASQAVLLSPGCFDLPLSFPGWNLPGVMAAGGIQAFLKSQQLVPGTRFVFAGSHPLQLIVADQIAQAGGVVAGVYFSQAPLHVLGMLRSPLTAATNADALLQAAGSMWRLRRAGVPVHFGRTVLQADGQEALQTVRIVPCSASGAIRKDRAVDVECDRLGVCFGFLASSELARQSGAACRWNASRGGWLVRHDEWFCSSEPGLFVAGEITAVSGAGVAALEGELAALGCAIELGRISRDRAAHMARPLRRRLARLTRFADMLGELSWPGDHLLDQLMSESATLCKCEELTVGDLRALLERHPHVSTANAAKLLSRAGMGLCQGRYCQFALTRLISRHREIPPERVGAFTARFPSKPVDIDRLIP